MHLAKHRCYTSSECRHLFCSLYVHWVNLVIHWLAQMNNYYLNNDLPKLSLLRLIPDETSLEINGSLKQRNYERSWINFSAGRRCKICSMSVRNFGLVHLKVLNVWRPWSCSAAHLVARRHSGLLATTRCRLHASGMAVRRWIVCISIFFLCNINDGDGLVQVLFIK